MKLLLKIALICLWIAIAAGVVAMMGFSNQVHSSKKCRNIICQIDYKGVQPLMNGNELVAEINKKYGKPQAIALGTADIEGISKIVKNNPYLENTDVKLTIEGDIMIYAEQSIPVIRYFSMDGKQQYISSNGKIMPVRLNYPLKSLIATGSIENPLPVGKSIYSVPDSNQTLKSRTESLYNIHYLAKIITSDTVLNALIEQVNILPQGKIQLATKAGSHTIYFGDTLYAAEKLENLKYFYKYGLVKTGWNKYKKLNLEYKNQIVCTK